MKVKDFKRKGKLVDRIKKGLGSEGAGGLFIRLEKGKNAIRLIGDWVEFRKHTWVKNKNGEVKNFVCSGKNCLLCKKATKYKEMDNEQKAKDWYAKDRVLWNALSRKVPEDNEGKLVVKVIEFGFGIYNDIADIIGQYGDITSPKFGRDIIIRKRGEGKIGTRYSVDPGKKVPLSQEERNLELNNLEDFIKVPDKDTIREFLGLNIAKKKFKEEKYEEDDEEGEEGEEEEDDEDYDDDEDDDEEED